MRQLINLWNRQFLYRSIYFGNRTHEEMKNPPTLRVKGSLRALRAQNRNAAPSESQV
jgi:hypothetical protein